MLIHFYKYQATGNDFILIDNRSGEVQLTTRQIQQLCDRKFGIGADGLMLIENHPTSDFNLIYYNSDGSQSLCGNGSRAAVQFASFLGMIHDHTTFEAYDGTHTANLLDHDIVRLRMNDVNQITTTNNHLFLNTGSPHVVHFVDNVTTFPVVAEGRTIRYSDAFKPGGTNVNFAQHLKDNTLYVRTYERGVEDETLSCGTGVTAAALAATTRGLTSPVTIQTPGGNLSVEFKSGHSGAFTDIYLIGPAKMVFKGTLEL